MKLDFSSPFTERTPRVVNAAKLHRVKERKKAGRILVEGFNSVDAAISTGAATDLFLTQSAAEKYKDVVTAAGYLDVYVHAIDDKAAASLSETVTTPGIFAVCRPVLWTLGKALGRKPQLVTVPVETSEPGNAGTLMRVSDSMGADAVIFAGNTVDPQSNKAARASAGSLFHIPVAREPNIKQVLGQLRSAGLQILATAADGDVTLDQVDLAKPTAWLLGNEAHGLDDDLLDEADIRVSIPIRGRAESLNLATAAAICLYQSARAQEAEE